MLRNIYKPARIFLNSYQKHLPFSLVSKKFYSIEALAECLEKEDLIGVKREMRKLQSQDQLFQSETLRELVFRFVDAGSVDMAARFYNKYVDLYGVPEDPEMLGAIVEGYCAAQRITEAEDWVAFGEENGIELDPETRDIFERAQQRADVEDEIIEEFGLQNEDELE